jgi:Protein of unknown function (DUF3060)
MNHDDPEKYIRDLERGLGETPGATPQPSGKHSRGPSRTPDSGQFDRQLPRFVVGQTFRQRVRKLASTGRGRVILGCAVAFAIAIGMFLANHVSKDTVHGHLIMINAGTTGTIDCNNGTLELDGGNNTYTVTGHCLRLDIRGSANKVTVDSADTIGIIGDDNAVIYHSGAPTINRTGNNNIVSERLSNR